MSWLVGAYGVGGLAAGVGLGLATGGSAPIIIALGGFGTKAGLMIGGANCVGNMADKTVVKALEILQNIGDFSLAGGLAAGGVWGGSKLLEEHCFSQTFSTLSDQGCYCKALLVGTVAFGGVALWTAIKAIRRLKDSSSSTETSTSSDKSGTIEEILSEAGGSLGRSSDKSLASIKTG